MDNIGELIKSVRKQKGYTQKQLAEKAGVSNNSLIRYENGETSPSIQVLQQIANALDVYATAFVPASRLYDYEGNYTAALCERFAHYLMHNRIDVLTCSDTKLMQLFAAFLEQRHK